MMSMREARQDDLSDKFIALTFDDGPHASNTSYLLDIAKEKAVRLTFFVIGQRVERNWKLVQRQASEGHEVGNHSWSHRDLTKLDDSSSHAEIQKTEDIIIQYTGVRPHLFRPPYGQITGPQQEWLSRDLGYKTIFWTIDSLDWQVRDAEAIARQVLGRVRPGSIVLFHDIHRRSVEAMPVIFEWLLSVGYKLVTVTDLLRRTIASG